MTKIVKYIFAGCLTLAINACQKTKETPTELVILPGDKRIEYIGRFDKRNQERYKFSYPGSEIKFQFSGKSVSVYLEQFNQMNATAYVEVFLDGESKHVLPMKSGGWIQVFRSPETEVHELSIVKRNEPWMGEIAFSGVKIEGSLLSPPKDNSNLNLLFIGASHEVGFGNVGDLEFIENNAEGFTYEGTNHNLAYPALASKELNAKHTCVCFGGKGLIRGYDGSSGWDMPQLLYSNLGLGHGKSPANMKEDVPDIVVLNLGPNDFVPGVPDKYLFVDTYISTINSLIELYPNAKIIISLIDFQSKYQNSGEPLTDYIKQQLTKQKLLFDYLSSVHKHFKSQNSEVYFWSHHQIVDQWGEAYHPTATTHETIAEQLLAFLDAEVISSSD